ncbi:mandelate racemase/muconate lactonizing enzyme family protein [Spirosoma utsteinense]|uniref:Dipeptide epimerase n=1 Tax=Spirosoma utsteinense TaxID=2585773 RepID=A0ABR6W9C6_9BACT|nr:dipeptide epimerase [Spirosoma utsteinense]MBC3787334.1 L-alanine-DL-glutamate epimerase-like enolase superfamily enzyme [Spirosoma utsteinense]MBC3793112.1 L-alanine-DL-glutamate epimerase-like enolase superfamily enzyme [Spirosoma utsteinense]
MTITQINLYRYDIALKAPIAISLGTIEHARNLLVEIQTEAGITGWGEGSPFWMIVGETQASGLAAAGDMARLLLNRDPLDIEGCLNTLVRYLPGHPTTRSAFDMALYDIAAKAANMPLYQFLGGSKQSLVTDETIYINAPERMAEDALRIQANGAEAIKVKLGTNARDDIRRVEAIRNALGDTMPIRTDANQGWDVITAQTVLRAIGGWNVQYCEQPIRRHDIAGLRQIRQSSTVPIMADESLFDATDAIRLIREEAVDYFNIKLSKSGGIFEALKINAIAEAAGVPCMIGCMSESRLGLTANAHFASARQNIRFYDLDGCFEHASDPVQGGIVYDKYQITLPDAPGIGAEVDPSFLNGLDKVSIHRSAA